ncbi:hypothetical protein O3M35_010894 [Rhynocoris fuscipes]|uniref:PX domain-containing protein n=1 Tax=Rhynocoris fuscipes TaxID=488301 RepID=A0AAW1D210_9HEMI
MACTETKNEEVSNEINIDLKDCLLKHMEISVSETEKRTTSALNIRDCYTVYLIETRITDNGWELIEHGLGQIWRRYSEFEQLRNYLCNTYPWAVIPPLPEKKHSFPVHSLPSDTFNPDFVDRRRAGLENFLHRIAQHPVISKDSMFLMFLQQEEGWRNSIRDIGYVKKAEDKLKAFSAVVRIKESDVDFDDLRKYCQNVKVTLGNILRIRSRASLKVYNIYKLNAGFGKVFSEWSAIEKELGDGLQRAGHFFDSIASWSDTFLEDEEQIIDQLKEYLFYASSIEDICCKRDMLQLEIEKLKDRLETKQEEKERILQGKVGVISRLFGTVLTEDMRTSRLRQIEDKIVDTEEKIKQDEVELGNFKEKTLTDVADFQKKKVVDLKDTLESFIELQIKMAKKGVQTWTNIKECIDSMPT